MINFIEILRKSKPTAAELRAAVADLSVADLEKRIAQLEADRRKALLFGSATELEKIDAAITSANTDAERIAVAIEELTGKIAEAEQREANNEIERLAAEARDNWKGLQKAYLQYHDLCEKTLLPLLDEMDHLNAKHAELNRALGTHGRTDLKTLHPLQVMQIELKRLPGNLPVLTDIRLPFYRPAAPDGITLAHLKSMRCPVNQ